MEQQAKKHVDVIVKYFYPVAGGIENNIMQTYTALQTMFGWDVTIHTTANTYTQADSLKKEEVINGLRVKRYHHTAFGFRPSINWKTTSVVALHNFDIFFIRYLAYSFWLKITGRKTFALIVTPHGGFNPEWSMFSPASRFVKKFYTFVIGAWFINRTVDGMRAVSGWERDEEVKYITPSKVHMIDNGLEDEAYEDIDTKASVEIKENVEKWGTYLLQIGRLYPIKNFETAIESLQFLPQHINLVIIGEAQEEAYEEKLRKLITTLHLESRVFFAGVVRGIDKYYVIRHAQAMVHMALWESGCNVVREGMSQGLPCVVSNVYGLPGLVKDGINGFCLSVHDVKAVAEKINWIMNPVNLMAVSKMREANIIFGKGQSWKEVARKMDTLYRNSIPKTAQTSRQSISSALTKEGSLPSLTIGLTAYNEAANIKNLLNSLLEQDITTALLKEIIVVSDASTDGTDDLVKSIPDTRIRLVTLSERGGANNAQNVLMKETKTDILAVLDSDVLPEDSKLIDTLIAPIIADPNVGLVSAQLVPLPPETFVESMLVRNHIFKTNLFASFPERDNIYTCFGAARALSKQFYTAISYPFDAPTDAYSYLFCVNSGLTFKYVPNAHALFRCPNNIKDHIKQSSRFLSGMDSLTATFGDNAKKAYTIPQGLLIQKAIIECVSHPILFAGYVIMALYIRLTRKPEAFTSRWEVATTSKTL